MAVKHILDAYKITRRKKEEDEKQKELQRLTDEQTRRRLNAGKVEQHLRVVVKPVLDAAQNDIREAGYTCDVEIISKRDPHITDDEQTFALCLTLTTAHEEMSHSAWLRYEGESDGVTLQLSECHGNNARAFDRGTKPLNQYNQKDIEQQVEAFVGIIFKA